jgi:nucleotide-binding universal stress UspA family protein
MPTRNACPVPLADRRAVRPPAHLGGLRREWEDAAWQRLRDALGLAFGGLPPGIPAELLIAQGNPGWILVRAACRTGDVLVIGTGRQGAVGRLWHGTVSRYCLAHARCR